MSIGETWGSVSSGEERWQIKRLGGTYWWPVGKSFASHSAALQRVEELKRDSDETEQFRVVAL